MILRNRDTQPVRISDDTELSGPGQRKTNSLTSGTSPRNKPP